MQVLGALALGKLVGSCVCPLLVENRTSVPCVDEVMGFRGLGFRV